MKAMKGISCFVLIFVVILFSCIACMSDGVSLDRTALESVMALSSISTASRPVVEPPSLGSTDAGPASTGNYEIKVELGESLDGMLGLFSDAPMHLGNPTTANQSEKVEYTDAAPESVDIGTKTLSLIPVSKTTSSSGKDILRIYEDDTGRHYSVGDSHFSVYAALSGDAVMDCNQTLAGEEDFIGWIQSCIKEYLPDYDFDGYRYSCTTNISYETPQTVGGKSVDHFCTLSEVNSDIPIDTTFEIRNYTFRYQRFVEEYEILDCLLIETDVSGNVRSISYQSDDSKTDWTTQPFEIDAVKESVRQFVTTYGVSDRCSIVSYDIDRMLLSCEDGVFSLDVWLNYQVDIPELIDVDEPVEMTGILILSDSGIQKGETGYLDSEG